MKAQVRIRIVNKKRAGILEYVIGKRAIKQRADGTCFITLDGTRLTVVPKKPKGSIYIATIQAAPGINSIKDLV